MVDVLAQFQPFDIMVEIWFIFRSVQIVFHLRLRLSHYSTHLGDFPLLGIKWYFIFCLFLLLKTLRSRLSCGSLTNMSSSLRIVPRKTPPETSKQGESLTPPSPSCFLAPRKICIYVDTHKPATMGRLHHDTCLRIR